MSGLTENKIGFEKLIELFEQTQNKLQRQAAGSVDISLVVHNWLFGWYIVEFEQHGADLAEYGRQFFESLSGRLKGKIRGSSVTRLKLYRSFYQQYRTDLLFPKFVRHCRSNHFNSSLGWLSTSWQPLFNLAGHIM